MSVFSMPLLTCRKEVTEDEEGDGESDLVVMTGIPRIQYITMNKRERKRMRCEKGKN